jgi:hypothetical protein
MSHAAPTTCQHCGLLLSTAGLPEEAALLCVGCLAVATPARAAPRGALSRKAVISVLLGAASVLLTCLTGLPAMVLGLLALRDIHRAEDRLRGRGVAITGILLGAIASVTCAPVMWAFLIPAVQQARAAAARAERHETTQPDEVAAVAGTIGRCSWPAGLVPAYACTWPDADESGAVYATSTPEARVAIAVFRAASAPSARTEADSWMRSQSGADAVQAPVSDSFTVTIAGQTVNVVGQTGTDRQDGLPRRVYSTWFAHQGKQYGITISTGDEPPEGGTAAGSRDAAANLTDEECRAFLESFVPAGEESAVPQDAAADATPPATTEPAPRSLP